MSIDLLESTDTLKHLHIFCTRSHYALGVLAMISGLSTIITDDASMPSSSKGLLHCGFLVSSLTNQMAEYALMAIFKGLSPKACAEQTCLVKLLASTQCISGFQQPSMTNSLNRV